MAMVLTAAWPAEAVLSTLAAAVETISRKTVSESAMSLSLRSVWGGAGWGGLVFVVGGWRGAEWWLSDFMGTERKGGRTHQVLRQGLVAIHLDGVRL